MLIRDRHYQAEIPFDVQWEVNIEYLLLVLCSHSHSLKFCRKSCLTWYLKVWFIKCIQTSNIWLSHVNINVISYLLWDKGCCLLCTSIIKPTSFGDKAIDWCTVVGPCPSAGYFALLWPGRVCTTSNFRWIFYVVPLRTIVEISACFSLIFSCSEKCTVLEWLRTCCTCLTDTW